MRILGLFAYYIFSVLNILLVLRFFKWTNEPRFRDGDGDVTTEVGYAEDSTGHVLHEFRDPTINEQEQPHITNPHIEGTYGPPAF